MSNLHKARVALETVLNAALPDFPVFAYVADSAPPPCAWIDVLPINYQQTFGTTKAEIGLKLTVITGRVNEQAAQDELDAYVSPDNNSKSIPYIVSQNPTLGGVVDYCTPVAMDSYGSTRLGDIEYLAADIRFEVMV